jgi:hypothetical protein
MKYAVEMDSGAMKHILTFIRTGSGIQKLIGGYINTQTAGDLISLLFSLLSLF